MREREGGGGEGERGEGRGEGERGRALDVRKFGFEMTLVILYILNIEILMRI